MELKHGKREVGEVRLHYVTAGSGPALVLIHGFPQTWRAWRKVIPALASHFTVIAPDYRGAGDSSRPATGYDKKTVAADINALVRVLGHDRAHVVGHDIGMMVAYAYAASFREQTVSLTMMDAFLPGTTIGDELSRHPRLWHLHFHAVRDMPEMLVAGREREYLTHFLRTHSQNTDAFPAAEIDEYATLYAAPGAIRAGFEMYRAFPLDAEDNRRFKQRKLTIPVMTIGGGSSNSGPTLAQTAAEVAETPRCELIAESGHFIPEEAPDRLTTLMLDFLTARVSPRPNSASRCLQYPTDTSRLLVQLRSASIGPGFLP